MAVEWVNTAIPFFSASHIPGGAMSESSILISNKTDDVLEQIEREVEVCLELTLGAAEQEMYGSPRWPIIRSRILKAFGDRGILGFIRQLKQNLDQ